VVTDFSPAFLGMFESLRMGPTFARGRRDERAGHVRSLTVSGSLVVALVRGPDDPAAFRARIAVRAFGASEWARVETALVAEARYVADLLDGRMPPGIEEIFARAGLTPLPLSLDEVAMDCTCERWPMPCAHLATTCYALARAFESDPFEVFTWRGRPRDELLMRLRRLREAVAVDGAGSGGSGQFAGPNGPGGPAGPGGSAGSGGPAGSGGSGRSGPSDGYSGSGTSAEFDGSADRADHDHSGRTGAAGGGRHGAGRADDGPAAAGHPAADPLSFWGFAGPAGPEMGGGAGHAGAGALLDQLDAPGLSHLGQPVVEVLRAAYLALPDTENPG
jgi:hypothetical protein